MAAMSMESYVWKYFDQKYTIYDFHFIFSFQWYVALNLHIRNNSLKFNYMCFKQKEKLVDGQKTGNLALLYVGPFSIHHCVVEKSGEDLPSNNKNGG